MSKIAILGGGSWGTGLSVVLGRSRRKSEIALWAREHHLELPITEQVHSILRHGNSPRDAIRAIMERPLRRE